MKKKTIIALTLSLLIFFIIFFVALMAGRYNIKVNDFFKALFTNDVNFKIERSIIIDLRLPRTLMAVLVGIGLSLSGLLYQETFRNKLVSPDLLGVSAGASVGAAIAIILGLSSVFISFFSFFAGLITVCITVFIARLFKNGSQTILLLTGIIISGLMMSILSFIKYFADPNTTLATIIFWNMGTFQNAKMNEVWILLGVVGICTLILLVIAWRLNLIALGRDDVK